VLALAARQALALGLADKAKDLAANALALNSKEFDALLVQARLHFLSHEPQTAMADLEAACKVRRNDVAALQLLLQTQTKLGMLKEAAMTQERLERARNRIVLMDRLSRLISQLPDDPEPRFSMGQAAMEAEMYTLAYQCFQAALDLDPKHTPAREAIESLRSRKDFDYEAIARSQLHVPGGPRPTGR
jgi:tetratricopeptide (TPR) repeat protein